MKKEIKEKAFVNHVENGFALNLPNGIRISTIFGWGSYTENHNWGEIPMKGFNYEIFKKRFGRIPDGSNDVEIMIDCPDEKWLKKINGGDTVIGHLTIEEWFKILKKCWKWKSKTIKIQ